MDVETQQCLTAIYDNILMMEERYSMLKRQQFTFIAGIQRCRENACENTIPVRNYIQVENYYSNFCRDQTSKRVIIMWLDLFKDLADLAKRMIKLVSDNVQDVKDDVLKHRVIERIEVLNEILDPESDFSSKRVESPHDEVLHLSCDEARNFFGGLVSIIPIALHCTYAAYDIVGLMMMSATPPPPPPKEETNVQVKTKQSTKKSQSKKPWYNAWKNAQPAVKN